MHVTVPTITGSTTVGNPLMIHLPDSLTNTASSSYGYYGYYFGLGNVTQQWMRGTTDIQGATSTSYTTVRADGSQTLSARLSPSLGESLIFAEAFGMQVEPFTTNAITMNPVAKYTTRAKLKLPKALHTDEPASIKVKVKAKQDTPAGFVTLKIGKYKAKKALQNGSVFFTLPHLTAGRYKVAATFHGTADFAAAKAKAKHLSVR